MGSILLAGSLVACAPADDGGEDVASASQAACTGVRLTANPGGPVSPGASVTLTATPPTCAAGETPEYRFAYWRVGSPGGYVQLQGFSASNTVNWNTTGLSSGQYDVIVYARAAGTTVTAQSTARVNFYLDDICTSATLAASPSSPQPAGSSITLTSTASCNGSATPEFRFAYKLTTASAYTQIQNWGSGTASWNTTGLGSGTYNLIVYTRAAGNTSSWEAVKHGTFQLGGGCSGVSVTTNPAPPQFAGTMVEVSANATCAAGLTPEYRFYFQKPGNQTWFLLQDWNGATVTWDTTGLSSGVHTLRADVRAAENATGSEAVSYKQFQIGELAYADMAVGVGFHTCATVNDGSVRCWGLNDYGQLGDETATDSPSPVRVSGLTGASSVAVGGYHSCAAMADGTARCWGNNSDGNLGDGTKIDAPGPVTVSGLSGVTAVSAGTYHSCALRNDGTVWCWGDNEFGQIGNGTYTGNVLTPFQVVGVTGATAIAAGGWHTCAIVTGGAVMCWGLNDIGQIGSGSLNEREPTPVEVSSIAGASALSAGDSHSCAIAGGVPHCWGFNLYGQLGDGSQTDSNVPVAVSLTQITQVSAGYAHSCARHSNGTLSCWGNNDFAELGDGSMTSSSTPVSVSGISGALEVGASGGLNSCALMADHSMTCWGDNFFGQLGNGSMDSALTPTPVIDP